MRDLDKALADITAIRQQLARSAEFRGYGPAAMAATALLAVLAGVLQAAWLPQPAGNPLAYVSIWVVCAGLAATLVAAETIARSRRVHSGLADAMLTAALEQLLPAAAAGGLITGVLLRFAPESLWMLPGLWQILCSLGVFASCRFLPRRLLAVALWYLLCGLACLAFAREAGAFSPWAMALPYGIGQAMAALLLRWQP